MLDSPSHKGTNEIHQFIEYFTQQTTSSAEKIAQCYADKVNDAKKKILNNREKLKKPPTVDKIITAIENRQVNMVQRAQYNIEQTLNIIFCTNNNAIN